MAVVRRSGRHRLDASPSRRHGSRGRLRDLAVPERFFRVGGTRDWVSILDDNDLAHFDERLRELAGDATDWVLRGRVALDVDQSQNLIDRRPVQTEQAAVT